MEIKRSGTTPSAVGPADYFTGRVRIDPLFAPKDPSRVAAALVTFEPGARTAWHTHPLGQHLFVTAGLGWVQREGGEREDIRPGDVVWFPPGEKHWHGATATTGMSHIAVQEAQDGSPVTWLEQVRDEEYGGLGPSPTCCGNPALVPPAHRSRRFGAKIGKGGAVCYKDVVRIGMASPRQRTPSPRWSTTSSIGETCPSLSPSRCCTR